MLLLLAMNERVRTAPSAQQITIDMMGELICEEEALDPSLREPYAQFKTLFHDVNGSSVSHVCRRPDIYAYL
jgi:hypothetical protein